MFRAGSCHNPKEKLTKGTLWGKLLSDGSFPMGQLFGGGGNSQSGTKWLQ